MTMRLDIVTNDAGELVRREHARDLGASVVIAIYRLAKLAQLHDLTNQAFVRQLDQTHQAIVEYALRAGNNVNVLFAHRAIFVSGQLLKGSRSTYDAATELGEILEWCGGSELTIQREVTPAELHAFAESISVALRSEKGRGYRQPSPRIGLRAVADAARLRGLEIENLNFEQRIVRTYASAVVIMRRFFEDLEASRYILPRRIKRVAQNLVDLSEGSTPAFLGVTEVRNQNHDTAGRAVNTAILAVTMARELTNDRQVLAQIAMASMMHDVGRPRAAALGGAAGPRITGVVARLSEEAEDKLAAGTAAVLTAVGRVNEPTIMRTVVAFEALWLRRQQWLGPLYRGVRVPTLQAKILSIARRYNDLLTPEPGLAPPLPDYAVATIAQDLTDPGDRTVLRLLVAALGLFPLGTVVQLSTGEVAEVAASGGRAVPDRPRVRLIMDVHGGVYNTPVEIDLASPAPGDPPRRIIKVVNIDGWTKGLELQEDGAGGGFQSEMPSAPSGSVPSIQSIKSISRAAREAPSNPSGSGVVEVGRGSYPSVGTSPSMVAEAMGRVMADGAAPQAPSPMSVHEQRTVMASSPLEHLERKRAETQRLRAAAASSSQPPVTESVRIPKDRVPTARGTLASTPVVHALVYMFDHALSGSVLLRESEGQQHVIYFEAGAPSRVRTGRPMALLGEELIAAQLVRPELMPRAIENALRTRQLLGEYLVANDILARELLESALASQVARKISCLVNLPPETDYAFYADLNLLDGWAGVELTPCHPLNAILTSVRQWHDRARIRATLGRIAKQPLSLHPQTDLSLIAFTPEETAVVDAVRTARCTITSLYQQNLAEEEIVSSLIYALAVTRCFAFTASKGPPMGARALPGVPPPLSIPPPAASVSSFPVGPNGSQPAPAPDASAAPASAPSVRSAPPARPSSRALPAVERHPSGSPPRGSDIPVQLEERTSEPPDPEAEEAERALQAMTDFRLAETALSRNDLASAERLAAKAVEGEPTNGEYISLLAWLRALSGKADAVNEAIAKLSEVLEEDALCERALLYRGKLLKRASRKVEALRDFLTVLDVNPKNSEAASEARLLRMQKGRR